MKDADICAAELEKLGSSAKLPARELRGIESGDVLVTCAQNNTEPHRQAWDAFRRVADHYGARLVVIPMRYRNPTSRLDPQEQDDDYWWHPSLRDYLVEQDLRVHRKLIVMGRMRIQATAVSPLSGLEGMSHDASAIYGHPQVQMRCIPTARDYPKVLHTTGSCTVRNYSDTKAGQKGEFHHTLGAVLVRKDKDLFFMRHLNFSGRHGTVCDLDMEFSPKGKRKLRRVPGIVTGDEHEIWMDEMVRRATYEAEDSMVKVLRPEVIVRHDVFDAHSIMHHHDRDPIRRFVKRATGYDDVLRELRSTMRHIDATTPRGTRNVVVASNHHDMLTRWLREADPKRDPTNALAYHELMVEVLREALGRDSNAPPVDALAIWARRWGGLKSDTTWLARNELFRLMEFELGYHGDVGPNGARGSPTSFAKLGTKIVGGHVHAPAIEKGARFVGHSMRRPSSYQLGPSSDMHCHAIIHPNGKCQLVMLVGWWRERT